MSDNTVSHQNCAIVREDRCDAWSVGDMNVVVPQVKGEVKLITSTMDYRLACQPRHMNYSQFPPSMYLSRPSNHFLRSLAQFDFVLRHILSHRSHLPETSCRISLHYGSRRS